MVRAVKIADRFIGPGNPCFIIAEAGVNHNGDIEIAHRLIDEAARAGADAVKFQSFITEDLIIPDAPKAGYQIVNNGQSGSQYDMLKVLELSSAQHAELKSHCEYKGILYLCTPYEEKSVDMLNELDVAAFKVASTDTTNIPLLRYIAQKKRPVILSTGMSTLSEVESAVVTLRDNGLMDKIIILQCTSEYPAPMNEVNLRVIHTMQAAFACPVGFSDHTPKIGASPLAVALGACIVEKHYTLDRNMKGPDHKASLEPQELMELVKTLRDVEAALGNGIKQIMPSEIGNKARMQKSIVSRRDIKAGDIITLNDICCKRPGTGLPPSWIDSIINKVAAVDIAKDSIIKIENICWN